MDPLRLLVLVVAVVVAVAALGLAALVLATTPRRWPQLALVAYLLATAWNQAGVAAMAASRAGFLVYNGEFYSVLGIVAVLVAYPLFVAANLDTSLTRPLRTRAARIALPLCGVLGALVLFARPELAVERLDVDAEGVPFPVSGPATGILFVLVAVMGLYTLASALVAYRQSPSGTMARRRAAWYTLAFGTQDAFLIVGAVGAAVFGIGSVATYAVSSTIMPLGVLVGIVIVGVAMLRENLFDAELRLKAGLRRGVAVSIFLAGFFVTAAVVEQYLQQEMGLIASGVAVGLMLFALRPIERAAERVADAAMPRVRDTAEYRTVRKREVYRAAVESALEDGDVTEKERGVLATLAAQLGLDPREAYELEREARAAAPAS